MSFPYVIFPKVQRLVGPSCHPNSLQLPNFDVEELNDDTDRVLHKWFGRMENGADDLAQLGDLVRFCASTLRLIAGQRARDGAEGAAFSLAGDLDQIARELRDFGMHPMVDGHHGPGAIEGHA